MSKTVVSFNNLSFSYGQSEEKSLNKINLAIDSGQCVVLCGKSGCGKSTLLRLINGLIPELYQGRLEGEANLENLALGETPITELVPLVGSVFQNPKTQYFNVDTTSELAFPCENSGMEPAAIKERIADCAELLELETLLGRSIFRLSGGEKQRIAFGTATMLEPRVLVLDEPTSNLDAPSICRIHALISIMKAKGCTILIAEHRLAWLADVADRYVFMEDGQIKESWQTEELKAKPKGFLEERGLRPLDLLDYCFTPEPMQQDFAPFLRTQDLTVGYGKKPVRRVPDFALSKGQILCLMGPNGAGKSTLAKTLCGLQKPIAGKIYFGDDANGSATPNRARVKNSFLVMQDVNYQLFADSVEEEVLLGARCPERLQQVLEALNLTALAKRHPMSLSGGQKQRVAIAAALLSGKPFIVLDEPTSGLDFYHMQKVAQLLELLKAENTAVMVITHDEELAAICADSILRLED